MSAVPAGSPRAVADFLRDTPFEALPQDVQHALTWAAALDLYRDGRKRQIRRAGVDWAAEREVFLSDPRYSVNTAAVYRRGLDRLEAWAAERGVEPLAFTAKDADDYLYTLSADGRAPAAVRLDASAASAFFSFLARRHDSVRNVFAGTRARPADRAKKPPVVPTAAEVALVIAALPPVEAAAAAVCAYRGLRVGALPTLTLSGGRYRGVSKGKDLGAVRLPREALDLIAAAGLDPARPFAAFNVNLAKRMLNYRMKKLARAGTVAAVYSHHDFRHFYAVSEYRRNRDIYRLKKLLNHASIAVTERYLQSMGEL